MLGLFQCFFMFSHISGNHSFPKALTKEEEERYLREYEYGTDEEKCNAKDMLIKHNLRLVAHMAKNFQGLDKEEIISIGTIGLIKGIQTYKSNRNVKLSTYASRCILNEILMYLRTIEKSKFDMSLQEPIGTDKEGNQVTMEERLADEHCHIEQEVELKIQAKHLHDAINSCLNERERAIIELRYGLATGDDVTQREIANSLDISRSYVSRLEKKALKKLHKALEKFDTRK